MQSHNDLRRYVEVITVRPTVPLLGCHFFKQCSCMLPPPDGAHAMETPERGAPSQLLRGLQADTICSN